MCDVEESKLGAGPTDRGHRRAVPFVWTAKKYLIMLRHNTQINMHNKQSRIGTSSTVMLRYMLLNVIIMKYLIYVHVANECVGIERNVFIYLQQQNMYTNMSKFSNYSHWGSLPLLYIYNSERACSVCCYYFYCCYWLIYIEKWTHSCCHAFEFVSEWDEVIIWAQHDGTPNSTSVISGHMM